MSEVATFVMTEAEALRLTERIRITATNARDAVTELQELVAQAQDGSAHMALGYASWTAYLAHVLGDEPLRLPRDERREVVAWLAGEGMSTRAIAPIVGVSPRQVVTDRREGEAGVKSLHTSESAPSPDDIEEDATEYAPEPRPVTGMDGKTYRRPEPRQPPAPRSDPKRGTDLHTLRYVIVPTLDAWAATWTEKPLLDDSVTAEEAAQILRDLSRTTPVLSQIRRLLNSRTGA